jgi:spore coat polysaccharide biosynthesis protein SpsF
MALILGLIQARMKSKRLPGKVLLPLLGKPVLWRIFERLKFSKKIEEICISTSVDPSNGPIVKFAEENNIDCYRGSEDNLVERHLGAAKFYNADVIVRITADCPLVDPTIIDELVNIYNQNPTVDLVSNTKVRTYPVGLDVEVFPTRTLEKLLKISNNPTFYEFFISMYIYEHPQNYKSIGIKLEKPNLLRWTLDYPEDYKFMQEIYNKLYKPEKIFLMNDILLLLKEKPEITKINSAYNSEYSHSKYERTKER